MKPSLLDAADFKLSPEWISLNWLNSLIFYWIKLKLNFEQSKRTNSIKFDINSASSGNFTKITPKVHWNVLNPKINFSFRNWQRKALKQLMSRTAAARRCLSIVSEMKRMTRRMRRRSAIDWYRRLLSFFGSAPPNFYPPGGRRPSPGHVTWRQQKIFNWIFFFSNEVSNQLIGRQPFCCTKGQIK